jgi:hypothetical protein
MPWINVIVFERKGECNIRRKLTITVNGPFRVTFTTS